jgi:aspartate kinase
MTNKYQVYKFGGASINTAERIIHVAQIIKQYGQQPLLIVISAMGKTTNELEKVATSFYAKNQDECLQLFYDIKNKHIALAKQLLTTQYDNCIAQLNDIITEAEWMLHDKPVRDYDYYYDQIVCIGELFSTTIVSAYLNEIGLPATWLDVRDIIRTDDNFRDANVDWQITQQALNNTIDNIATPNSILVTQGFVGATDENESTTLGREGSDYTAAIFANLLNANSMTIWKDVDHVMSADPKQFAMALPLAEINYEEVIEMAFYGAQVIHPKTIKPLFQKNIPLLVKSFLNPALPGTIIQNKINKNLPPIIVKKEAQVLMHFKTKDFSFVSDQPIGLLYEQLEALNIRPNLSQNGAISFYCCVDDRVEKNEQLAFAVSHFFEVTMEKGLTLLTIRHYTNEIVSQLTTDKHIVLKQQVGNEIMQLLFR